MSRQTLRMMNWFIRRLLPPLRPLLLPVAVGCRLVRLLVAGALFLEAEWLKGRFAHCGRGVWIHGPVRITGAGRLTVEDNVHINRNAFIRAEGGLRIGANTHISRNLLVYTCNHDYEGRRLPYDDRQIRKPVSVGRNVWIGMNVCITPGVTIGDGAVIGMGTVVSKDVPALAVVGNAPQRILKQRNEDHYLRLDAEAAFGGPSGMEIR